MSRNIFTAEQVEQLRANPYVVGATDRRITYTVDFKKKFVEEYRLGKGPRQIFKDAGFDVDALGYKRIERASDRWRTENNEGKLSDDINYVEVHRERNRLRMTLADQISMQTEQIRQLIRENEELRHRLAALEQGK